MITYRDVCTGETSTPLPPDCLHVKQVVLVQVKVHVLPIGLAVGLDLLVVDQAVIEIDPGLVPGVHHGRARTSVVSLALEVSRLRHGATKGKIIFHILK